MNVEKAFDAIIMKEEALAAMFPLKVNAKVAGMLDAGAIYVAGRDRHFRPVLCVRPALILGAKPEVNDVQACIMLTMNFIFNNMLIDGVAENLVTIND